MSHSAHHPPIYQPTHHLKMISVLRFLGEKGGNFYPVERDTPNAVNLVANLL